MSRKPTSKRAPEGRALDLPHSKYAGAADAAAPEEPPSVGDESTEDYSVGYRRPPLRSRFKKGQSGNPQGRAKQSRNFRTVMKLVMDETMQVREGSRLRHMPAIEALIRTTMSRALKGDPKAVTSFLILMRQTGYGVDEAQGEADPFDTPEIAAIVDDILARAGGNGSPSETTEKVITALTPPKKPTE